MVSQMKKGAVIVDVAIDQGGCVETARPTTHSNPSYTEYGVVHYCVTNIPAAVPHTSTLALTNATFPYVMKLARNGVEASLRCNKDIHEGVNTFQGKLTYQAVADSQRKLWSPIADLI
jgi:alanine dehydrogenase